MKQKILSYLSTEKNDLNKLCKFLYDNPEESYKEFKSCNYIVNFLKERNFIVNNKFLGIENSFIAHKGSGHPKVCYLCEYDSIKDLGHVTGHNILSTISITAGIGLAKATDHLKGSVIIIGCPGEYLGGSKSTMVRQNIFNDIDAVMEVQPNTVTQESGSSAAVIPLKVTFMGSDGFNFLNNNNYNSLETILMCFSMIDLFKKSFPKDVYIDSILSKGGYTPLLAPLESEGKFYIRGKQMDLAKFSEKIIKDMCSYISRITNIPSSLSLYEPPSEELLTNITLNRLYNHNLKENGIIDIAPPSEVSYGISLGTVSHKSPTINPHISIVDKNSNIKLGTKDFALATLSDLALERSFSAALSIIFTGLDLLENENLLAEVKSEFFSFKKNNLY